jgi:hypothetical protein
MTRAFVLGENEGNWLHPCDYKNALRHASGFSSKALHHHHFM